jgi:hypothetical protein
MKLIDAINNLEGESPIRIPNTFRCDFPDFLVEMGYKVGAEIGVYKAQFTDLFCKAGLKMYAIDPWKAYAGAGRTQKAQDRQDFLYSHACRVLAPYSNCTIIRKSSMDALSDFKDGSLDFVYIDADHTFRYVAEDIVEWEKKVRKGGIVSGHDYFTTIPEARNVICHVEVIVDAYVRAFNIEKFYIFGKAIPGEEKTKDDKYPSWMWIKK